MGQGRLPRQYRWSLKVVADCVKVYKICDIVCIEFMLVVNH